MKKYILLSLMIIMLISILTFPVNASTNEAIEWAEWEYSTSPCLASATAGERFESGSMNAQMYKEMKAFFEKAAAGKTTTAKLTINESSLPSGLSWTESQLGVKIIENDTISEAAKKAMQDKLSARFDLTRVVLAVLSDCPYEQFWYDKSRGVSFQYSMSATSTTLFITSINFTFNVSSDYQGGDKNTLDANKVAAAKDGIESSKFIVDEFKNHNDFDKLKGYAEKICAHASYDHDSVNNGAQYGNPWQLIHVFDGLTDTNVVCEGYAKAFKYLCDLTDFEGDVKCYTVSGTMNGGTGAGAHMWNVVTYNGENYLVDVTNCDKGTIGNGMKLFMRGGTSSDGGKTYKLSVGSSSITYVYDDSQKDLFGSGYLVLATRDAGACDHSVCKTIIAKESSCTEQGWKKYVECTGCHALFDTNGDPISAVPYLPLASHTPTQVKSEKYLLSKGNCVRPSLYFESCKYCKKALDDTFEGEKTAHDVVDAWFVENGYHFHRCSVCTYKEDYGKCSGGSATCNSLARCTTCKLPYGDYAPHKFGSWKTDESTHWKECSCYQRTDVGQHTDNDQNGKCDSCSYSMPVASEPPKEESKPPVEESKPIVNESKPPIEESKPPVEESKPIVNESKPPVEESKPIVNESKPPVEESKPPVAESKPAVPDESVKNSKDESITPPEASDESIFDSSNVSLPDESTPENSETESTPTITDESVADESETEISDEECSHLDESISDSKPDTSYSVENIKSFDTKTIVTIAVSIAAAVAVATLIIIIVKKKK